MRQEKRSRRQEHRESAGGSGQAQWLDKAVAGIRFKPDRAAVRSELAAHLEDKQADLQRIFPDLSHEEAENRALAAVGDPEELGRELARIHKPWLGYLWRLSQVLLAALLVVTVLLWAPRGIERAQVWGNQENYGTDTFSWYLRGDDPTQAGGPLEPEAGEETYVERELVLTARPDVSVHVGDYTLLVERLTLWQGRVLETGREFRNLYFTLTAWGPPWQKLIYDSALRISGTDNLGNRYYSTYETHWLNVERKGNSPSLLTNVMDEGIFSRTFSIAAGEVPREAEWLRLEYDWGGTRWELTIPLAEEGEP